MDNYNNKIENKCNCPQIHVHEFVGSVRIAEKNEDLHNHCFAGVSEETILIPGGHFHKIYANTDFYENHYHEICIKTEPQIATCDGKHIHFVEGCASVNDCHKHDFIFATLIENPIGE